MSVIIMGNQLKESIKQIVESITARRSKIDELATKLRTLKRIKKFDKYDHESWCLSIVGDALIRIRLFIEQNFIFIETMGVIAVSRYLFELSVWLKLFEFDSRYGLVYYNNLINTQLNFYKDNKAQLERECILLNSFEDLEKSQQEINLQDISTNNYIKIADAIIEGSKKVDDIASRKFSIYAEQAKINGYGFQSYLIKTKDIPNAEQNIKKVEEEKSCFEERVSAEIRKLIPKRWNWKKMAKKVNLSDEYEYIYSYTSKLLHATPASITTNSKNLELSEMRVFLKYIDVKIHDIQSFATSFIE
jgi:hypothetical protein